MDPMDLASLEARIAALDTEISERSSRTPADPAEARANARALREAKQARTALRWGDDRAAAYEDRIDDGSAASAESGAVDWPVEVWGSDGSSTVVAPLFDD